MKYIYTYIEVYYYNISKTLAKKIYKYIYIYIYIYIRICGSGGISILVLVIVLESSY